MQSTSVVPAIVAAVGPSRPANGGGVVAAPSPRPHADIPRRIVKARRMRNPRDHAARKAEAMDRAVSDLADLFAAMSLDDTKYARRRRVVE